MQPIILRQDQAALKNGIYQAWNNGARNVLGVLATGGGKSVISSDITLDYENFGAVQCVMAHRVELVGQMSGHVARRGIYHRLIAPKNVIADVTAEHRREFGRSFINPSARCAVGGVDTILSRKEQLATWFPQVSLFTIDEAHHVVKSNKWGQTAKLFTNAVGLGITASPSRADGLGLGSNADGIFDDMVLGLSMRQLIDIGALSEYQIIVPDSDFHIDESDVAASGDFSTKKMREAAVVSHIVGDVVKEYQKWANGKRGITFATDVETATEIAAQYNAAGIPAAAVSAKTPAGSRAEFIRRFRDGRLLQLVNVDLFGEGFDVPAVEVVSMARPTASLAVYLQQFGRALRILAGKPYGLVIDHVSNYKRHGLPDKPRAWTLDRREKRSKRDKDPEDIDLKGCTSCSLPYLRVLPKCPYCGSEPPLPDPRSRTIEMVDGDMRLLDVDVLAEMRRAAMLDTPAAVYDRSVNAAGIYGATANMNKQLEKIEAQGRLDTALDAWADRQRALGRSDAESYRRFFLTTGVDVLTARAQSRADMIKLAETVEGWP